MTIRRWKPRQSFKSYLPWAALFAVPLALNGLIWAALARPPQRQLAQWLDTAAATGLKPQLAELLAESRRVLMEWERTDFTTDDPSAVTQTVERLARQHRVQLGAINAKPGEADAHAPGGAAPASLTVDVSGRFSKLAQWMSDVERQSGLQIESWTMAAGATPGDPHKLTVNLTAFLRGV